MHPFGFDGIKGYHVLCLHSEWIYNINPGGMYRSDFLWTIFGQTGKIDAGVHFYADVSPTAGTEEIYGICGTKS